MSLELLQTRSDRAQGKNEKSSQLSVAQDAKASSGAFPFGVIGRVIDRAKNAVGSVPDSVSDALDTTALAGIASMINSTLLMLDEKADELLGHCEEFKSSLLGNVSAAGDKGIETLESMVMADMDPLLQRWTAITQALSAAAPPIEAAMRGFGLKPPNADKIKKVSREVTEQLQNSTKTIEALGNTTLEEKEALLSQLNATVEAGLSMASSFKDSVVEFLQGTITQLGQKLGVELLDLKPREKGEPSQIYDTLESLMQASQRLAEKMEASLASLFTGPLDAAEAEVSREKAQKSGCASLRSLGGLLLAGAGLAASWL